MADQFDISSIFPNMPKHISGPKEYGPATAPQTPKERSLDEFTAFDRTPQVQALIKKLYGNLGVQQSAAGRMASKLGASKSSGNIGQMANLAAQTEDRAKDAQYQAQLDAFKEKMAQKQFAEQMDVNRYKAELEKYKMDQALNEAEDKKRAAVWGHFAKYMQ